MWASTTFSEHVSRVRVLQKLRDSTPKPESLVHRSLADDIERIIAAHDRKGDRRGDGDNSTAFLMIIIDDLPYEEIWRAWIGREACSFYIHAKYPDRVKSKWVREHLIHSNLVPEWGSFELLYAQLLLLQVAYEKSRCSRFVFVSESCIPVVPFHYLRDMNMSMIKISTVPNNGYSQSGQFAPLSDHIPEGKIGKASQWVMMVRDHVKDILAVKDILLPFFKKVHCSDEMFFGTVVLLLNVNQEVCSVDMTYTKWQECNKSPEYLTRDDIRHIVINKGYLFARKINLDSKDVYGELKSLSII